MTPFLTLAARLAAVTAVAGAGSLLAACGTAVAPSPTKTVTQTIPAGAGATSPASAASPAAATSSAPAGPPGCLASGLQGQLGVAQGTAGTFYQVVVLTNTSGATCTLYGYPGVSFVTGVGGHQVGKAATRNPVVAEKLITLAPGDKANMLLAVHDAGAYPPSKCQPAKVDWLRIYPPGDYGALYVQYNAQTCANQSVSIITVSPVATGAGSASY